MKKGRAKIARKLHQWPGLILAFFLILFSVSGIVMNHRHTFSGVDIPRKWLPESYHYNNWNLASARGSFTDHNGQRYLYGNAGIWKTDSLFSEFQPFHQGIPSSADHRKTYAMAGYQNKLYAATHFGLYVCDNNKEWKSVELPVEELRIADIITIDTSLYVMTRSHLLRKASEKEEYEVVSLPQPAGLVREMSLFKTLWNIHSGEFFGLPGKLFVDLMGIVTIILSVTGIIFFINPHLRKHIKIYKKHVTRRLNRYSMHYHNRLGRYLFVIIGLIGLTGMFLRPPLLIPIANTNVPIIPYTHYDTPNPWYDKLRALMFDEDKDEVLIATTEGMYRIAPDFSSEIKRFRHQPVVSVMGITAFEQIAPGDYLVGSFSGLYRWIPDKNYLVDLISRRPAMASSSLGNPVGATAVAGFAVDGDDNPYLFDYDRGAGVLGHSRRFGEMPGVLTEEGTMSLWNVSLEIHTGRIYASILGDFYILIVPLAGLTTIMVVISGYIIYRKRYRKKHA